VIRAGPNVRSYTEPVRYLYEVSSGRRELVMNFAINGTEQAAGGRAYKSLTMRPGSSRRLFAAKIVTEPTFAGKKGVLVL
jgi:hypothetical protein